MLGRLSLRARLILGVIALAAVGLVAADVATYSSLRSFLLDRTDSALEAAHPGMEALLRGDAGEQGSGPREPGVDYVQVRRLDNSVVTSGATFDYPVSQAPSAPKLPAAIAIPASHRTADGDRVAYFTVPARSGAGRYRVRASIETQKPAYILVLASSLNGVDSTLHRLRLIELLVTAAALAGIALLGLWVVRRSLRPLDAIAATAAAIAAGDLSRRVARAEEKTEVGRLGLALNAMLAQIESAFRAREASEAKLRRFVSDASHELRTPLAAVRAFAELFERGAASRPDDLSRSMTGISRESERMTLLVDDLLLLARLDEGRPLERQPVSLDDVVAEAVETARTLEPARPIELELEPATVVGDRDRLRQVIDNLLANVRAHTPAGAPVSVALARDDGRAVLTVADSGPGLDADQVAHVFERFYRTDVSRARASGGVGLGLSIVAAVAEAHGGSVSVTSGAGHGATFRIELPLSEHGRETG